MKLIPTMDSDNKFVVSLYVCLLLSLLLKGFASAPPIQYLMPFVEKERYKISSGCRLHPDNDLYRDQEQNKIHIDFNEWRCGYCKKSFYEEKYLDKHFDNRH